MIVIKAGGGRLYEVTLGAERIDTAYAVWSLWNGGPGVVGYYPKDVNGHCYLDDSRTRPARAYRVGRVTVRELPRQ